MTLRNTIFQVASSKGRGDPRDGENQRSPKSVVGSHVGSHTIIKRFIKGQLMGSTVNFDQILLREDHKEFIDSINSKCKHIQEPKCSGFAQWSYNIQEGVWFGRCGDQVHRSGWWFWQIESL